MNWLTDFQFKAPGFKYHFDFLLTLLGVIPLYYQPKLLEPPWRAVGFDFKY